MNCPSTTVGSHRTFCFTYTTALYTNTKKSKKYTRNMSLIRNSQDNADNVKAEKES